jgi:hypothetical protein
MRWQRAMGRCSSRSFRLHRLYDTALRFCEPGDVYRIDYPSGCAVFAGRRSFFSDYGLRRVFDAVRRGPMETMGLSLGILFHAHIPAPVDIDFHSVPVFGRRGIVSPVLRIGGTRSEHAGKKALHAQICAARGRKFRPVGFDALTSLSSCLMKKLGDVSRRTEDEHHSIVKKMDAHNQRDPFVESQKTPQNFSGAKQNRWNTV